MLKLQENVLTFDFPEVHPEAKIQIIFQRTFRIPDDGKEYPLPPGLGKFPVKLVDDCKDRVPAEWAEHGGVMLPMYQAEAMWVQFLPARVRRKGARQYPFAIRVAAGKVNAVSGEEWKKKLKKGDYMVAPPQKWLDGFCIEPGKIRQFVAMPLGWGLSVEQQVTGKEEHGGLQIEVYPMRGDEFEKRFPKPPPVARRRRSLLRGAGGASGQSLGGGKYTTYSGGETKTSGGPVHGFGAQTMDWQASDSACENSRGIDCMEASEDFFIPVKADMGLGAGGQMTQQIYDDPYGKSVWVKKGQSSRTFVHLANSFAWEAITKYKPPPSPCTAENYSENGFPWFEHYIEGVPIQEGGKNLKAIKSVLALGFQKGIGVCPTNNSIDVPPEQVVQVNSGVRNGNW